MTVFDLIQSTGIQPADAIIGAVVLIMCIAIAAESYADYVAHKGGLKR